MRLHALSIATLALFISACGGGDSPTDTSTKVLTSVVITTNAGANVLVGQSTQFSATPRDQNGNAMTATVSWSSSAIGVATVTSTGLVSGVGAGVSTITATATSGGVTVSSVRQVTVTGGVVGPVLTSISLSAPATNISTGASIQLTATPKDQNGNPITATVTWTSSDNAKATVSGTGLLQALAAGTVTITVSATAASATVSNTLQLTVVSAVSSVLTTLSVAPASPTMVAGQSLQFTAAPLDQNGTIMQATITWSTSNSSIATVTGSGLVTAVADGTVTITATAVANGITKATLTTVVVSSFGFSADVVANFSNQFAPPSVDIARGGTVTWTFSTTHNVTFTTLGSPEDIPNVGGGTVSRVFNTAGTFNYTCTLHGGMNGMVVVH